jgi:hypothetical protein
MGKEGCYTPFSGHLEFVAFHWRLIVMAALLPSLLDTSTFVAINQHNLLVLAMHIP